MVRVEGLEPPRLAAPEPKSGASTNFATPAYKILNRKNNEYLNKGLYKVLIITDKDNLEKEFQIQ